MSKKTKATSPFKAVVQMQLSPDDEPRIEAYMAQQADVMTHLEATLLTGYTVKLDYDDEYDMYSASLFGKALDVPNAGNMLYGNGDTLFAAIAVLMFKHVILSDTGKWSGSEPKNRARFS